MSFRMALKEEMRISGVGIHSGKVSSIRISPGNDGLGIRFHSHGIVIPASTSYVVDARRCTSLGSEDVRVDMVEHLLSALFAMNIRHADIHIDGEETPILDGGAVEWVKAMKPLLISSNEDVSSLSVLKPITRKYNDSVYCAIPSDRMRITCVIDFSHPLVGLQIAGYIHDETDYEKEIAPARTFGFIEEVEALHAAGLGKGGNFKNTLVIYPDHFSTPELMHSECCRHKLLDMIGDFSLGNALIKASITAYKPSHFGNTMFLKELLDEIQHTNMEN